MTGPEGEEPLRKEGAEQEETFGRLDAQDIAFIKYLIEKAKCSVQTVRVLTNIPAGVIHILCKKKDIKLASRAGHGPHTARTMHIIRTKYADKLRKIQVKYPNTEEEP